MKHYYLSCPDREPDSTGTITARWDMVECRVCCIRSVTIGAAERLAELDYAQGPVIGYVTGFDGSRRAVVALSSPPNPTGRLSTTRTVDVSLLTRLSDFIASIPGNALDRKSNALAMELRREIADVVCPADKVRG